MTKIKWRSLGCEHVAGADEVGRGCLAGPVFAAAVILHPDTRIKNLTDSKLLTAELRTEIAEKIKAKALAWAIGICEVEEIDAINIHHASLLAMKKAVTSLSIQPQMLFVDGKFKIEGPWPQQAVVEGDLLCTPISAASIIAKVARDELMTRMDEKFPHYGFKENKGYGTPKHLEALSKFGPTSFHRKYFAPVMEHMQLTF